MVSSALLAATLAAAIGQAKPDAVVLTSSPFITKPALTSSRTIAIYEANRAVREHLLDRIEETWSIDAIEAEETPPISESDKTFYVHLDWPSPERVVVGVAITDQTLAERSIETNDIEKAKAMVWLLVRSTIERALLRPIEKEETPPIAEAPPSIDASSNDASISVVSEPREMSIEIPKQWAISLMVLTNVDPGQGVDAVPSIQGRWFFLPGWTAGAELTFRHEELTDTADIYHLPLTLSVGIRPWDRLPLEIGAYTTIDIKFVSLPNDAGGAGAGWYVGPYTRGRWKFYSMKSSEFAFVADAGLAFALKRDRYYVGNETLTDGVVAFRFAGGLEWSWH